MFRILFFLFTIFRLNLIADDCCIHTPENIAPYTAPPPGMVWIPPGEFIMGSDYSETRLDESPAHRVHVHGFWMDITLVTNKEFKMFVQDTGYITTAERSSKIDNWYHYADLDDLPVICISWFDANAYATWAHKRLPTEAEFEYAAYGGRGKIRHVWGNEEFCEQKPQANFNQKAPSAIKTFPPNGFSLDDMAGNVWQWCADSYSENYYAEQPKKGIWINPQGPKDCLKRVQRGGSFLCKNHRITTRGKSFPDQSMVDFGFRCVKTP